MRILFGASPAAGHLLPLLPLADAALAAGHEVAFLTAAEMAPLLGDRPLLAAGPGFAALMAETQRRDSGALGGVDATAAELFAGARVDLSFDEARGQALAFGPDLIVAEQVDYVGAVLAADLGVPWAAHAVGGPLPAAFVTALDERAREQHERRGLPPRPRLAWLDPYPTILRLPDDPPPADDRVDVRPVTFTGPERELPPRGPGPRALICLGTMVDDHDLVGRLARSVADTGVEVLVTADPAEVPEHPGVHAVGFVPLAQALPTVDVVLGAGGTGTVLATLAAGLPTVLRPVVADQPANAVRATHQGSAVTIEDPVEAGPAVARVLDDPSYRAAAAEVAEDLAAMRPAPGALLEILDRAGLA